MSRRLDVGRAGEARAEAWYRANGYRILARNWRVAGGELDLIAARRGVIVFCEVKTRSSDRFMDPALAVDHRKQARIRTAALRWLESHRRHAQIRFDVAIIVDGRLRVIEQAF